MGEHIYIHSRPFRIPNISVSSDITNRFHDRDTWMIMGKAKQNQKAQKINYILL